MDAAGRLATLTHSGPAGSIDAYGFTWDAAGRLVGVTSADGTATFAQSTQTTITFSAPATVGSLFFLVSAPGYTFRRSATLQPSTVKAMMTFAVFMFP